MMRRSLQILAQVLIALNLISVSAWAHGSSKPEHGGVVEMDGETLFELVVQDQHVELYVVYDDEEIDSSGYTASLIVKSDGDKRKTELIPAGENKFEAKDVSIPEGAKVTVFIKNQTSLATSSAKFVTE
jgi:hypothetical protein